jgi:hypothetical protein
MVRPDGIPEDIWNEAVHVAGLIAFYATDPAKRDEAVANFISRAVLDERDRWLPAVTYFDHYCQDEADDVENCVCGQEQHIAAKNFRDVAHPGSKP